MPVKQYRKRPVVIDAIQWDGTNLQECADFLGDAYGGAVAERHPGGKSQLTVKTLEGQHIADRGDYIIRGVQGEHYPCKPGIFEQTYESVGSS